MTNEIRRYRLTSDKSDSKDQPPYQSGLSPGNSYNFFFSDSTRLSNKLSVYRKVGSPAPTTEPQLEPENTHRTQRLSDLLEGGKLLCETTYIVRLSNFRKMSLYMWSEVLSLPAITSCHRRLLPNENDKARVLLLLTCKHFYLYDSNHQSGALLRKYSIKPQVRLFRTDDKMLGFTNWQISHILSILAHVGLSITGIIAFVTKVASADPNDPRSHLFLPLVAFVIVSPPLSDGSDFHSILL